MGKETCAQNLASDSLVTPSQLFRSYHSGKYVVDFVASFLTFSFKELVG
jgi:hypothetical protein